MARLPATQTRSSPIKPDPIRDGIVIALHKGLKPPEIAQILGGENRKARKFWRAKIWRMLESDVELDTRINRRANAIIKAGLLEGVQRLTDRGAHLGKVDALRLLMEASGFHNPKVKHEHTGDISISLNLPRPALPEHVEAEDVEVLDDGNED